MGNPWVFQTKPIPLPTETHTHTYGYGFLWVWVWVFMGWWVSVGMGMGIHGLVGLSMNQATCKRLSCSGTKGWMQTQEDGCSW